jgi:hypothetical protein
MPLRPRQNLASDLPSPQRSAPEAVFICIHLITAKAGRTESELDHRQQDGHGLTVTMWLPGAAYLNAIYEEVRKHGGGTGSITADLWNRLKDIGHYIAYGLAFVGGLVHGFVASLWDAIAGIASMIYDVLKSIFTLNVVSDVKELIKTIEGLSGVVARIGDWWRGFGWDRTQSRVLIRIPSCRSRPTLRVATIFRSRSAR